MQEVWKDIIIEKNGVVYDFTGRYEISNLGRIRNVETDVIRKCKPNKDGYVYIGLKINGKREMFKVHRLVATAFIPNPNNLPCVNHKDEIKTNNSAENLEWCSYKYNNTYGTVRERRSEKVRGQKRSEETKQKMSEAKKGKSFTEEHKHNLSESKKGGKHPQAKKVICVETGQVFDTIKEAKEWLGKGNINDCLRGKQKVAGGYHWEYYVNK